MKSKVMAIANRLVAQGYSRVVAMIKAWALVKLPLIETKVAGVTFENRQEAIKNLSQYDPSEITINLTRDPGNPHDGNAIAVYAAVEGKGLYFMGYLPKALAAFVAPVMDTGRVVQAAFREIRKHINYGLCVGVKI